MLNLIGISGYIGSGKDTVAKMIIWLTNPKERKLWDNSLEDFLYIAPQGFNWEIKKFAYKLKQIVSLLTGIPVSDLEKESVKSSVLPAEWNEPGLAITSPGVTMTVRSLLQKLGTDAMRDRVHPNIHVNALFADYLPIDYKHPPAQQDNLPIISVYPNWIISDLRFPNEFKSIKDRGGICIRINRGKEYWNDPEWLAGKKSYSQPINLHPSETALDNTEFDYTIQNSGTLEELLEQVRTMLLHFKIIV